MRPDHEQHTPIEDALSELAAAERSGVFTRTSSSAAEVLSTAGVAGPVPLFASWRRFGLPAVAVLAFAFTIWGLQFKSELGRVQQVQKNAHVSSLLTQSDCFQGPGAAELGQCLAYDSDSDGDVDLADFARLQATFDPSVRR
jgi:hypothetical protein